MTEENDPQETPKKPRNTKCEVRMFGVDGERAVTQACDSLKDARAWLDNAAAAGKYEIVKIIEDGELSTTTTNVRKPRA